MRRVVVLALAGLLVAPVAADAAPRRVCRLLGESPAAVVDAPNAALHIASADVASNATHLTAVIRMKTLDDPQAAVTGRAFSFWFSRSEEETYALAGTLWGSAPGAFRLGAMSEPFYPQADEVTVVEATWLARATVVVDAAKHAVRMTVPLAAFRLRPGGTSVRPGTRVTYLAAEVARMYGTDRDAAPAELPDGAPTAVGTGARWTYGGPRIGYTLGAPSCVVVGR